MTTQAELLDKVRELCSIPSDNALALRANVSRQIVSEWRNGGKNMGDDRIAQLCAMAKLDAPLWIAGIHAVRATDATERRAWESVLERLRPIAAAVGLVALLALPSQEATAAVSTAEMAADTRHYAK